MRVNKYGFIVSSVIAVLSIIFLFSKFDIVVNIALSLLGSSFVTFVICLINYYRIKKEKFYEFSIELLNFATNACTSYFCIKKCTDLTVILQYSNSLENELLKLSYLLKDYLDGLMFFNKKEKRCIDNIGTYYIHEHLLTLCSIERVIIDSEIVESHEIKNIIEKINFISNDQTFCEYLNEINRIINGVMVVSSNKENPSIKSKIREIKNTMMDENYNPSTIKTKLKCGKSLDVLKDQSIMKINFKNKDKLELNIRNIEDYKKEYPPKDAVKHWVDGRSAKECAKYILSNNGNLPNEIVSLISSECNYINVIGEYVAKTSVNTGKGNVRNHDLFLYNDDVVISIEAKADESFGTVMSLNNSENYLKRYDYFCNELFGKTMNEVLEVVPNCKSQLVNAIAYTILEAIELNVKKVLFVVLVLKSKKCLQSKIDDNKNDFDNIVKLLTIENKIQCKLAKNNNIDFDMKYIVKDV